MLRGSDWFARCTLQIIQIQSSFVETVLCNFGLGSVVQALDLVHITQECFNHFPSPFYSGIHPLTMVLVLLDFSQLFSCLSAPLSFFAFLLSNHVIIRPFSWTSSRASRDKAFPLMRCSYTHMGMAKYVVSQSGSSLLLSLLFPLLMGRAGLLLMSL